MDEYDLADFNNIDEGRKRSEKIKQNQLEMLVSEARMLKPQESKDSPRTRTDTYGICAFRGNWPRIEHHVI